MRLIPVLAVLAGCAGIAAPAWAQPAPGTVVLDPAPDIAGVIRGGTRPEVVVRGLKSADDPIWLPGIGLVFSESQANRVVRLDERDQVTTFVGDLPGPLGMTFDRQGRLISLQTRPGLAGPRVIWPAGQDNVIADRFEGRPFGRPNDIVSDRSGGLYFSDLGPRPNGLGLSRDEKTLYVNDTGGIHAYAFDVLPDGRLANRRVFIRYVGRDRAIPASDPPVSNADGLVLDDEGRLYALTEAGIEVASPEGRHLGVIPVWCITRRCQNLAFGGPEKQTLYVAGGGTLLRIQMLARGVSGRAK